jgi:hypothetical protein
MANPMSYPTIYTQPSLIASGWPKAEDGNVYLSNVPDEQKEYSSDAQCTIVRHPSGYTLLVDDKIKDRLPLEYSTDKKIQALARKYVLMEDCEFKKAISQEMRCEFSYEIAEYAIEKAKSEKGSLYDARGQEWSEISFSKARLDLRIQKYEQRFETPYSDVSSSKEDAQKAWLGYFLRNNRLILNKSAKEALIMSPVIAAGAVMLATAWVITRVVFSALNLGTVVGAFVLRSLVKKLS